MSLITIYQSFDPKSPKFERHINQILNRIKTGSSKDLIYQLRSTGDKSLKLKLPSILFSGQFSYRNAKSLIQHSGFICIDFDNFPDSDTLLSWKDTLEGDVYVYSIFLSPSGNGLKCLIKIPPIPENHKGYFEALKEYFDCPYFDIQCSDICRICFESYDPYMSINPNSVVWDKVKEFKPVIHTFEGYPVDEQKTVEILLKWWTKKFGIYSGSRNANLFKLCAAFNDYGVNKDFAEQIVSAFQQEDFRTPEILHTLKSAYNRKEKFGTLKFSMNNNPIMNGKER